MKNKSENNQQLILSMGKGDEILFKTDLQITSLALIIINNKSDCEQQR